jgi:L-amino acid N-acyltransferase YncA
VLAGEAERNDFHKLVGRLFTDNVATTRLVERCGFSSVATLRYAAGWSSTGFYVPIEAQ